MNEVPTVRMTQHMRVQHGTATPDLSQQCMEDHIAEGDLCITKGLLMLAQRIP